MKKNDVLGGLILIGIAVLLVGQGLNILPNIPWFKIIGTILLAVFTVKQLWKREFFSSSLALGCIVWIWEESIKIGELQIAEITPFPLLVAAGLVGAGLNMIFGKKPKIVTVHRKVEGEETWESYTAEEAAHGAARVEEWEDGRHVTLTNVFNSTSKYVNSEAFSTATFENVFGSANVYFDNAIIAGGQAVIDVENVFGQTNLYFPSTWRLQLSEEGVFGSVKVYGKASTIPGAPLIIMNAESVFGNVNIYFQ